MKVIFCFIVPIINAFDDEIVNKTRSHGDGVFEREFKQKKLKNDTNLILLVASFQSSTLV